jgi:hypothetical protein
MQRYAFGDFTNFSHQWIEQEALIAIKKWLFHNCSVDEFSDACIEDAKRIRDEYTVDPIFDTKNRIIEMSYSIIKEQIWKL